MKVPSKDDLDAEFDKIRTLYAAYCFINANAENDKMREQIIKLGQTHIWTKIQAIFYSVDIPTRQRIEELEKAIREGSFPPPPDSTKSLLEFFRRKLFGR